MACNASEIPSTLINRTSGQDYGFQHSKARPPTLGRKYMNRTYLGLSGSPRDDEPQPVNSPKSSLGMAN